MASHSSNVESPSPEEEVKEENIKCFRLFNRDKTYKFDVVKKLLEGIKAELSFDISIQEDYFDLRNFNFFFNLIQYLFRNIWFSIIQLV